MTEITAEYVKQLEDKVARLEGLLATEVSLKELESRGLQLPEKYVSFHVGAFKQYQAKLKGVGGIYTFTHETEGYLYVGISTDVKDRLGAHIARTASGNKGLQEKLTRLKGVKVTVYREPDRGLRELYENYLILRYQPEFNQAKMPGKTDGFNNLAFPVEVQNEVIRRYSAGTNYITVAKQLGLGTTAVWEILNNNGIKVNLRRGPG